MMFVLSMILLVAGAQAGDRASAAAKNPMAGLLETTCKFVLQGASDWSLELRSLQALKERDAKKIAEKHKRIKVSYTIETDCDGEPTMVYFPFVQRPGVNSTISRDTFDPKEVHYDSCILDKTRSILYLWPAGNTFRGRFFLAEQGSSDASDWHTPKRSAAFTKFQKECGINHQAEMLTKDAGYVFAYSLTKATFEEENHFFDGRNVYKCGPTRLSVPVFSLKQLDYIHSCSEEVLTSELNILGTSPANDFNKEFIALMKEYLDTGCCSNPTVTTESYCYGEPGQLCDECWEPYRYIPRTFNEYTQDFFLKQKAGKKEE